MEREADARILVCCVDGPTAWGKATIAAAHMPKENRHPTDFPDILPP